jgi:hypothetical protein
MSRWDEDLEAGAIGQKCGKYSSVGSLCVQPAGHTEPHRSAYGSQWTDESDRKFGEAIARSMEGKRD